MLKYFNASQKNYLKKLEIILEGRKLIQKNQAINIKKILSSCKIDQKSFIRGITDKKIKNELKILTNLAFEKNIFGAPTFIVNNKLFWGQDRLEYALEECFKQS